MSRLIFKYVATLILIFSWISWKSISYADNTRAGSLFAEEHIGALRHGLPSKEVLRILGKPEQLMIGDRTENWNYPHRGINLVIGIDPMGTWVDQIVITAPSKLKTARGAGIGMEWTTAKNLYKEWTQPASFDKRWYWVGNLTAGLGFEVNDDGTVSKIVLGTPPPESQEVLMR